MFKNVSDNTSVRLRPADRYQAWTNITKGEDNLFAVEHRLLSAAASAEEDLLGSSHSHSGGISGDVAHGAEPGAGVVVSSGEAADGQDAVPRPWWSRRSVKRWRPEDEVPVKPPDSSGGEEQAAVGPAVMRVGRQRWKG